MKKNNIFKTFALGIALASTSAFAQTVLKTVDFETAGQFNFGDNGNDRQQSTASPSNEDVFDTATETFANNTSTYFAAHSKNAGDDAIIIPEFSIGDASAISIEFDAVATQTEAFSGVLGVFFKYALNGNNSYTNWFALRDGLIGQGCHDSLILSNDGDKTLDTNEGDVVLPHVTNTNNLRVDGTTSGSANLISNIFKTLKSGKLSIPNLDCNTTISIQIVFQNFTADNQGVYLDNIKVLKEDSGFTWTGTSSSDWTNGANWQGGTVPGSSDVAVIPGGLTNYPSLAGNIDVKQLMLRDDGRIKTNGHNINTDGTDDNILYCKTVNTSQWNLLSSPVEIEGAEKFRTDNSFPTSNRSGSTKMAVGSYQTNSTIDSDGDYGSWDYISNTAGNTVKITQGLGYAMKSNNEYIKFEGKPNDLQKNIDVEYDNTNTASPNGFNALGNPYTTSLDMSSLLTATGNAGVLKTTGNYWVWNPATSKYESKPINTSPIVGPLTSFFIETKQQGTFVFNNSYQTLNAPSQRSNRAEVQLSLKEGNKNSKASVYFIEGTTNGFDNGYEGKVFGGFGPSSFGVSTQLVADNNGVNYEIQSLPKTAIENTLVPVSVTAKAGKKLVFSAKGINLPEGVNVYLVDKTNNKTTNLSKGNYNVALNKDANGIGQFYLQASTVASLSTKNVSLDNLSVYASAKAELTIAGLQANKAKVSVFSILGKEVLATTITTNGVAKLNLPSLATGVYIVKISSNLGEVSKKVIIE